MPFLVETWDKPGAAALRRQESRAHMAYLKAHKALLLACGAKRSDDAKQAFGGIYLLDVESRDAAEAFIAADPFNQAGLFERVVVQRWSRVFFDGKAMPRPRREPTGQAPVNGGTASRRNGDV